MKQQFQPRYTPTTDDTYCQASNVPEIVGVTGAFCGAALITVVLRLCVRTSMLGFIGADDWAMLAAMVMAIGTFVCFIFETNYGIGRHTSCASLKQEEVVLKWQFYQSLWVMLGVVLVKISIAFFLMRLAPKVSWKRCLWGTITFLVCFALSCAGTLMFNCVPVSAAWNIALKEAPSTTCFSLQTFINIGLFNSIVNICTDLLFAVLPIPIIAKLQINLRTKISLTFVLSLGFVACAAGIVKARKQAIFLETADLYWHDGFMLWNFLELCLGILAASLPSLKPLFGQMLAGTRTALGMSGTRSKAPKPSGYPGASQNSGYRRQYDPHHKHEILADVDLQEYKQPAQTTVKSRADSDRLAGLEAHGKLKRLYNVRVISGDLSSEGINLDEGHHNVSRSDSEERLRPPNGIYRTLEVSSTSEPMRG
ncbi:hypothetical protein LTR85_003940 [Meristemomyces frigidus]|nr:hypothetical protein LTR85_003940 [Meristemomyces frigidus]